MGRGKVTYSGTIDNKTALAVTATMTDYYWSCASNNRARKQCCPFWRFLPAVGSVVVGGNYSVNIDNGAATGTVLTATSGFFKSSIGSSISADKTINTLNSYSF